MLGDRARESYRAVVADLLAPAAAAGAAQDGGENLSRRGAYVLAEAEAARAAQRFSRPAPRWPSR